MTTVENIRLKRINELNPLTGVIANDSVLPIISSAGTVARSITVEQLRDKQILQVVNSTVTTQINCSGINNIPVLSLTFTAISSNSILLIDCSLNSIASVNASNNYGIFNFGWNGSTNNILTGSICNVSGSNITLTGGCISSKLQYNSTHDSLGTDTRTYQVFGRQNAANGSLVVNHLGGTSSLTITEIKI